ncbi:right-handed parallel beta-helix repeat-containing protein [Nonomuraea rubra]|uniref:right-handed parallel beta-helix repeat-containing protein n=1 Tax=Nonomuraea rubra TaxID=46180 RepID=UPI003F4D5956
MAPRSVAARAPALAAITAAVLLNGAFTSAFPATAAAGTTYHVSPSGSDANPGTSSSLFWHIQRCAAVMTAGDTCQIASGTYARPSRRPPTARRPPESPTPPPRAPRSSSTAATR